ncbi:hypothetical protein BgiBS90_029255, partial [Biomphalaria glabrata]
QTSNIDLYLDFLGDDFVKCDKLGFGLFIAPLLWTSRQYGLLLEWTLPIGEPLFC